MWSQTVVSGRDHQTLYHSCWDSHLTHDMTCSILLKKIYIIFKIVGVPDTDAAQKSTPGDRAIRISDKTVFM